MAEQASKRSVSRAQEDMSRAIANLGSVAGDEHKIYGGLCHSLPILVRTCGLCQTLAFIDDKAVGNNARAAAYRRLRAHIASVLEVNDPDGLLRKVVDPSLLDYMRFTRRILQAWVYYKRFAVSMLGVEAGPNAEEG